MEKEIQEKPLSRGAIFAGVAVAVVTIVGTVVYMERSRQEVVETETEVMANLPNQGQARPAPPPPDPALAEAKAPPGYAVGGAGAMNAFDPRAPQAAPRVELLPDANIQRAYDAMGAQGNATTQIVPQQQAAATPPPAAAAPAAAPRQQQMVETAWGRTGDARQNLRVFEVEIRELHDGRMFFDPVVLNVRIGEAVRIVVRNSGEFAHSVVIAPETEILRYRNEVKDNPNYWLSQANWLYVAPTEKGELVWQFTQAGTFEFSDVNPGRREAGLVGRIVVR